MRFLRLSLILLIVLKFFRLRKKKLENIHSLIGNQELLFCVLAIKNYRHHHELWAVHENTE